MVVIAVLVAAVALATAWTGGEQPTTVRMVGPSMDVQKPQKPRCRSAREAIVYYRTKTWEWQDKQGARHAGPGPKARGHSCGFVRKAVEVWQARAVAARRAFNRWIEYHWDWQSWLPGAWYQIGSCETGYGGDPNWRHNSGTFQGAFGFHRGVWDEYRPFGYPTDAHFATPRQQYDVALILYAKYGFSPWGCA